MAPSAKVAIGLRIGQTYSSIAITAKDGRTDCIANEDGERQIPTMIAFMGDEEFTGTQAKLQALGNPKNTIAKFRNLIGLSLDNILSETSLPTCPISNLDSVPGYIITHNLQEKSYTVSEIATKYISRLRESAEDFLGQAVDGAVLAIPLYFTQSQREALRQAAEAAGLRVLQLIHEPTAAAVAYYRDESKDVLAVIVDLGSESIDVTVMSVRSGMYTILGTAHSSQVGGNAFDDLLVAHFSSEFKRKTGIDISSNKRALTKLKSAVESTKKTLSSSTTALCSVESLAEGIDFNGNINRTRFEIMSRKLFDKCVEFVKEAISNVGIEPVSVEEVIFIGGAIRIPKLQARIRDIFSHPSTVIRQELEPDEVISYGCAYQASLLINMTNTDIAERIGKDITVTPHLTKPVGIINANGNFVVVVPNNTPLPVRRVVEFSINDDQHDCYISVWEGELRLVESERSTNNKSQTGEDEDNDNTEDSDVSTSPVATAEKLIAEIALYEIQAGKNGMKSVEFSIEIDAERKCTIGLKDQESGKTVEAVVNS
ncbi:10628_t:CDS:2 [Paraglomus occultum]|uniref:10628_t:CDS:1 n=1 Tax=Paraglomus occultum TaxID=144539 RepID=A0A9N9AYW1_9GLOM|nr:10628_t:CDS:2 [Paraglomus occultum]